MLELIINDQVYEFNFGMGFLREINKLVKRSTGGFTSEQNAGYSYYLADMLDGNAEALVTILNVANKGQSPRVTPALLDAYIDDPDTDVDQLYEDVLDFLSNANSTRKATRAMLEALERSRA